MHTSVFLCPLRVRVPLLPSRLPLQKGKPDAVVAGDEEDEVADPGRAVFWLLIPTRNLIEKSSEMSPPALNINLLTIRNVICVKWV